MKIPQLVIASWLFLLAPVAVRAAEPGKPLDELTASAEKGDAQAQYQLGQACLRGRGVPKAPAKALAFFKKAADQGHAEATGAIGYFYANGLTVPKDLAGAAEWFRQGAEKGGAKAQLNYGQALLNARGVNPDEAEGMKWIDKAVAQGLPQACAAKGEFFFLGSHGLPKDYAKAREILEKAAADDLASAHNMLGLIHQEGLGVPADLAKAEACFRKAAEQGDAKGMSYLGQLLGPDGPDASKHVEALQWLLLAQRANDPEARNILHAILPTRPPEVVRKAEERAKEFKPRPVLETER
ncbi:MAG: sel1 repeat family protein [Chthoniobacter sp.]|nr:sel1 repeat family protein [Chthoniobacter sp.]